MPKTKIPGSDRKPQLATADDNRINTNPYDAGSVERKVFNILRHEDFTPLWYFAKHADVSETLVRKALKTISLDKRTPNVLQFDMDFRFQRGYDYIAADIDPTRIDV